MKNTPDGPLITNFSILEYGRTCQSALAGIASGILGNIFLGLTGTYGFLFYVLTVLIQTAVWEIRSGFKWNSYFPSRSLEFNHSFVGGLFTYVLAWVFFYGIVHVY
ncbi:ER membrane protein complex subunit 6 [Aphelenchoides bicaudatus]|nr:ER membrane protein complex subunit 6 [Aphelenchoides bicaudatus]